MRCVHHGVIVLSHSRKDLTLNGWTKRLIRVADFICRNLELHIGIA